MEQNEMTFSQLGRPILLASASPRRRELLTALGLDFTVKVSNADESVPEGTPSREAVELVARRKAAAVAEGADPDTIVIAADTTVDLEGEALGKPRDDADAARMLRALSGRAHSVFTGVAVAYRGQMLSSSDATAVLFRPLTEEEIAAYVATGEPRDKAGAYGIQGKGGALVDRIQGEFDNVVGLPCRLLDRLLSEITN
jgi:septum formation protein